MRFVSRHPEYRQVLRDGTVVHKASYAFPEVRQVMLGLIREATTDIDAEMAEWNREAHKVKSIRLHTIDGVDVFNGLSGAVFSGG